MKNPGEQIGGIHYSKMKIQPTTFIMENGLSWCQGNVIKYVCRYADKNGIEDLEKAKHYIDIMINEINDLEKKIDNFIRNQDDGIRQE
jgi:hypothetical protein